MAWKSASVAISGGLMALAIAAHAFAADPGASTGPVVSAGYRAALSAWLERHKRYPGSARARGEEGHAMLRFRVDRSGRVLNYAIVGSTGFADLDAAIDRMMRGASLPAFPADMSASDVEIAVTIRFALSEAEKRAGREALARERAAENAKRAFNDQAGTLRAKFAEMAGASQISPPFSNLWANPFPYVGKVVNYRTNFIRMQTATEGIFGEVSVFSAQPFVVKDIPEGALRRPGAVIIAGKVLGNTKLGEGAAVVQVPLLAYTNVHVCNTDACDEYFGRR